jgi:nucleotide-binding universal stress UspA family protein
VLDEAELHVVHAWSMPGESLLRGPFTPQSRAEVDDRLAAEEERRAELLDRLLRGLGAGSQPPKAHLIHGEARAVIPALARDLDIDLIALGTVCRTGLPGLLMGNTAEEVLRQVDCSVLTVKPEGFSCPDAAPS